MLLSGGIVNRFPFCVWVATATMALSAPVLARIGDYETSITEDSKNFELKQSGIEDKGGYKIFTLSGEIFTVQEYALKNGKIFAIAWKGSVEPNLSSLVNDSYQYQLRKALEISTRRAGIRETLPLVQSLKVQRWAKLRSAEGSIIESEWAPKDFKLNEIK